MQNRIATMRIKVEVDTSRHPGEYVMLPGEHYEYIVPAGLLDVMAEQVAHEYVFATSGPVTVTFTPLAP